MGFAALLRLVMMLRGQKRLLDYHLHTNAHYVVCPEADVFRIQPGSASSRSERNQTEYYEGLTVRSSNIRYILSLYLVYGW